MKKTSEQILKRAICLLCVSDAASLENPNVDIENLPTVKERNEQRKYIYEWLKNHGYEHALTEREKYILQKPVTNESDWNIYHFTYCYEAIEPLLWTLNLCEIWSVNIQLREKDVYSILNTGENHSLNQLMNQLNQRKSEEVEEKREIAMLWHWRTRTKHVTNVPNTLKKIFPKLNLIVKTNFEILEEDFAIQNKPFKFLTSEEKQIMELISFWRHYAFEWLTSIDDWDDVSTTT